MCGTTLDSTERAAAELIAEAEADLDAGRVTAEDVRVLMRDLRKVFGNRMDAIEGGK